MSPKKSSQKDRPEMAPRDPSMDSDEPRHAAYGPSDAAREAGESTGSSDDAVGVAAAPERSDLPEDQEELREQIAQTRAELGDTVEALSAKADVKAQASAKVDEGKQELRDKQAQAQAKLNEATAQAKENPAPYAGALGALVGLILLVLLLRRRGS
jgi:ElaB/YqjD/DUF883 family membrane-anchored ribosome-binding protein